jgi:uncharacterized protein YndB with AHSA1/START domain
MVRPRDASGRRLGRVAHVKSTLPYCPPAGTRNKERLRAAFWIAWRIISVDPPRSLEFEDGRGPPNEELPTYSVEVRLIETPEKTTMTITSRFASIADMEQLLATGKEEGMRLAVGRIDAIPATTAGS